MKILFPVTLIVLLLHLSADLGYSQVPNVNAAIPTTNDELSQPTATTRVVEKVKIPMRDGVRLVADIVFPETESKHPTILIRTPYGRRVETDWIKRGQFFTARGYAVVVQAVRGREDSEGEWQPWVNERKDGYDTIDWISRQSWSDGNVGMLGGSYLGEVQLLAAAEGHPALKCIVPYVSGSERVAHRFEKGHRIGLAIRSEWFPLFARNLNTAEPIKDATRIIVAHQTIYADSQRLSILRLKLLPPN